MAKKIALAIRLLMGFIFAAGGIAFFVMTPPPPPEGPMGEFFKGMMATGYFFTFLKVTEIVCGLMLLAGRFVPLALVVLAPIVLNIFLVHAFMARDGLILSIVLIGFETYLAFFSPQYSPAIKQLFKAK